MAGDVAGRARRGFTWVFVVAVVVVGAPRVIPESIARLRDAALHVRDPRLVAEERFFGAAWTSAMERLRRTIPRDGEYRLLHRSDSFEFFWVRYGLAPRRAVSVREDEPGARAPVSGTAAGAPAFIVRAREAALGPELVAPNPPPGVAPEPPLEGTKVRLLRSIGGVLLLLVPGLALTTLVPKSLRVRLPLRLGLAYLLGVAYVGATLYALSFLFQVPLRRGPILCVAILPVMVAAIRQSLEHATGSAPRPRPSRAPKALIGLAIFVSGIISVALFAAALAVPVIEFDGRAIWCARARDIRADGSVLPPLLREGKWSIRHPKYPVLMPVVQAAAAEALGMTPDDDRGCRPIYALFFPAMLLALYGGVSRLAGSRVATVTTLLAATLTHLSLALEGGAASTYSDLPLACFWGSGLLLLLLPRAGLTAGLASGLLFSAAILTKDEGLFLALFAFVALFVFFVRSRRSVRPVLVALVFASFAAALLLAWRSRIALPSGRPFFDRFGVLTLLQGWKENAGVIAGGIFRATTSGVAWGIFPWLCPVVFLLGMAAFRRRAALPLAIALGGAVCVYLAAYALVDRGLPLLVAVTWNRFLIQMSLPFLALFALALREALRPSPRATPDSASG